MPGAAPADLRPVPVMHVLAHDAAAGTELMTATLAERSAQHAVKATVVTLDAPGVIAARLQKAGVPVRSLGPVGPLRGLLRLVRTVRELRPEVICGYGFRTGLATRLAARTVRPRARAVTGVRGLYVTEIESLEGARGRTVMAIERATAPLVDAYVANSTGAIEVLAEHGIPRGKLHYVPNGLDAGAWPNPDRSTRPADGDAAPLVLHVGRFTEVKRQRDLVEAAALLRDRGIAARFVLAGDGPLRQAVEDRACALGLADTIAFPGSVDRPTLATLFAEADLACLVSTQEGMPGSVMEAMACGLPVIGTAVNGITDLVVDGVTGRLVPARTPTALADALAELLDDPPGRRALGVAGRQRIVEQFSVEGMVSATCGLQRTLAGEPRH